MPFDSLRAFLTRLEAEGQLVRIKEKVKPEPDIRRRRLRRGQDTGRPCPAL
jgi:UbiD family decarboxylase